MRDSVFKLPRLTRFVECPFCHKVLRLGTSRCPECREEITEEYARASSAVLLINTVACGFANNIRDYDLLAVIVIILSGITWLMDLYSVKKSFFFPLSIVATPVYLLVILAWFGKFGRFPFGDERFQKAKQYMKTSLAKWLIVLSAQAVMLYLYYHPGLLIHAKPVIGAQFAGRWETSEAAAMPAVLIGGRTLGPGCYPPRGAQAPSPESPEADAAFEQIRKTRAQIVCIELSPASDNKLKGTVRYPLQDLTLDISHGTFSDSSFSFNTFNFFGGFDQARWEGRLNEDGTLTVNRKGFSDPADTLVFKRNSNE
jgi:hypothetical protein